MKLSPGRYTDPRVDSVWGAIQFRFRKMSLAYWAARLGVTRATVSREFMEFPQPDSMAIKHIRAIETVLSLVDLFGTEIIDSIAEQYGLMVIQNNDKRADRK